jgi:hypothetical protein
LEGAAKGVVLSILSAGRLSHADVEILLDWLDKVRVGLWLAHYQLANNPFRIVPKYHISSRIGMKDRFAAIYRSSSTDLGLWFTATDNPLFYHSPTCFCLTVNNVSFQSASTDFMLSRRLGFPHPKKLFAQDSNFNLAVEMQPGQERVMHPPLRVPLLARGSAFYQCVFTALSDSWDRDSFKAAYDTPYVRSRSSNWDAGRARILFASVGDRVKPYPDAPSKSWLPENSWDRGQLMRKLALQTLQLQVRLFDIEVDVSELEPAQQQSINAHTRRILDWHRGVIAELKREP